MSSQVELGNSPVVGRRGRVFLEALAVCSVAWLGSIPTSLADEAQPELDVPYEPTHPEVVDRMLTLAEVTRNDVVYDLGCGDGRIVIAAAKKFRARGLGVDLDPQRLKESEENARIAEVSDRVEFRKANLMEVDLSEATVVTLYLLDEVNLMLRPKLFRELNPGTRIVSHAFDMGDWESDRTVSHPKARDREIHHWVMPAAVGGYWTWTEKEPRMSVKYTLRLNQQFQKVGGLLGRRGTQPRRLVGASLAGRELEFKVDFPLDGKKVEARFRGIVEGDTIQGTQDWNGGPRPGKRGWTAYRRPMPISGEWRLDVKSTEHELDGRWRMETQGPKVTASYTMDSSQETIVPEAAYVWGRSFRFECSVDDDLLIFTGFLNRNRGAGKVKCDAWDKSVSWSMRRISRD